MCATTLFISHFDQFETLERLRIDQGPINENGIVPYVRASALQMKAAADIDRVHLIIVSAKDVPQLTEAFLICSLRQPYKHGTTDADDVSSFQSSRRSQVFNRPVTRQCDSKAIGFRTPARRAHDGNDRYFVHDYGRIFDKHCVREIGRA